MSKINKISVDGISYDLEDKSVPSWAKSSAKPSYKTSELENDSNFITEAKVDEKIANVASGGSIDLSNYATKEYVDEQISNIEVTGGGSVDDIIYANYDAEIIIGYILENSVKVPVFRKIFKGEKVAGSNLVFDTTSLNIDKVLNMQGSTDRGGWVYPLMRYEDNTNYTYAYYIPNDNKLIFTSGTSSWCSTGSVTIILEYIKTTN